jgi:O-antigen ligase
LIWSGYREETAVRWRFFASTGLLAALLLLWLCASRAAWLALLVGVFYTAARSKFGGRWRWPCLIAVVISVGLLSAITLTDKSRWTSVSQRQSLLRESVAIWSASPTLIDSFGQRDDAASVRRVIGYGADQQALLYADQSVSYLGARPDRAHQYFVDLLLESGPLSVLCMLGLVVAIWRLRRRDAMDGAIKLTLAMHFISMQAGFALTAEKWLCTLWLMLLLRAPNQTDARVALPQSSWAIRTGLLALAASILLTLWPGNRFGHSTMRALDDFQNGQRAILRYQQTRQRADLAVAADFFARAQQGEPFEPVYGLAAREFAPFRDR